MKKKEKLKKDSFIDFGQKIGGVVGIVQQTAEHSTALANNFINKFFPDNKQVSQNQDSCSQCLRKHDKTSIKRDKSEIKNEKKGLNEGAKKL